MKVNIIRIHYDDKSYADFLIQSEESFYNELGTEIGFHLLG
jgi:hypothetical protein